MDKDLKEVLIYGFGTLVGYSTIISIIYSYLEDINLTIIYTLLITVFMWLIYIQKKLSKRGKTNDKK